MQQLIRNKNKRNEEKIAELADLHRPLSPPTRPRASRPRPAARLLDKLTVEEMPASSRRYPFVGLRA